MGLVNNARLYCLLLNWSKAAGLKKKQKQKQKTKNKKKEKKKKRGRKRAQKSNVDANVCPNSIKAQFQK